VTNNVSEGDEANATRPPGVKRPRARLEMSEMLFEVTAPLNGMRETRNKADIETGGNKCDETMSSVMKMRR